MPGLRQLRLSARLREVFGRQLLKSHDTSTAEPTLGEEQRNAYLLELIQTNGGCRLPCWWGFMPGQTSWNAVRTQIVHIGGRTNDYPNPDGSIYHGVGGLDWYPNGVHIRVGFIETQNLLHKILITTDGYSDPSFFLSLWKQYSPEELITAYGTPTRIEAMLFGSEQGTEFYELLFFYDNQGILAAYKGKAVPAMEGVTQVYRVCPAWRDHNWLPELKVYLQTLASGGTLDQLANVDQRFMPLSEISATNVDTLASLLRAVAEPACFETPASSWP